MLVCGGEAEEDPASSQLLEIHSSTKITPALGAFFELRQAPESRYPSATPPVPPPHQCIIDSPIVPCIVTWDTLV